MTDKAQRQSQTQSTKPAKQETTTRAPVYRNSAGIIHLQRTYGNDAINRLIQAKLTVGATHDPLEQEADRVADRVVSGVRSTPQTSQAGARELRRNSAEEDELMTKRESKDGMMGSFDAGSDFERQLSSAGGGKPLDTKTRSEMEAGIGADLSNVRIHNSSQASQLNRSISAKAFTRGKDVFFDRGQYNPGSTAGKHLLAHELTHVVQQGGAANAGQSQRKTADIQRRRGIDEIPKLKTAVGMINQAVKISSHTDLISNTFESEVTTAQNLFEPVPKFGLMRNAYEYCAAINGLKVAANRIARTDKELFEKENEGKEKQKGLSLWKRANMKRAANASAVLSYRKAEWTSAPGQFLRSAMGSLVTGRKYKNSIQRASWSYRDTLRASPEYKSLKQEFRAFMDSVDYASDGSGGFVRSIEPSVFIQMYATRIASSVYDESRPEAPWYQPTLRSQERKAKQDVVDNQKI